MGIFLCDHDSASRLEYQFFSKYHLKKNQDEEEKGKDRELKNMIVNKANLMFCACTYIESVDNTPSLYS